MQELAVALADVQAFNGFGNRFLCICARRSKLVPLPSRMPVEEIAPIQHELWRLLAHAQQCGLVTMSAGAMEQWANVYPELSREHSGLAGSIIDRAEAQTMRLALIYALSDGRDVIQEKHLDADLALWRYAQDSTLYIFGDRTVDPLEEKILNALQRGPLTAMELSACLNRHVPIERHAESAWHIPGQRSTQPGEPRPGHPAGAGENRPTPGRTTRISAALATLERYTREFGTALVTFERFVERRVERVRERQRSRGPGG